ncbi:MAG: hypothetical protein AUJ99_00790 [Caldisericum sp. CG2_30_36_11]|jgi:hypothetical protein|nr:hypothetical protein [Caldisericota bacterium]OIP13859.1 MAG: hypothetical protein AUJ99_00790 [Caldisericum sp. CG2_30_36_11]
MRDLEARFTFASLLITIGLTFIFNNVFIINSFLWTFIALFLVFTGTYNTVKAAFNFGKASVGFSIGALLTGIVVLLFEFSVIQYSLSLLLVGIFSSLAVGYIISGVFFYRSVREVISGIILAIIASIFFLPSIFNIPGTFFDFARTYWLGIILITVGLLVFLPRRGGKSE